MIHIPYLKDPGYGKVQIGLYIAAVEDRLGRARLEEPQNPISGGDDDDDSRSGHDKDDSSRGPPSDDKDPSRHEDERPQKRSKGEGNSDGSSSGRFTSKTYNNARLTVLLCNYFPY